MGLAASELQVWTDAGGSFRYAALGETTPVVATHVGGYDGDTDRPGLDELAAGIDLLPQILGCLARGLVIPNYLNGLAPSISGTTISVATGACLLDGHVHRVLSTPETISFSGAASGTYHVYLDHAATDGIYSATLRKLIDASWPATAPYVRLCTVAWNGSTTLSSLVDTRYEHQVLVGTAAPRLLTKATTGHTASPRIGDIEINTADGTWSGWQGSAWVDLGTWTP